MAFPGIPQLDLRRPLVQLAASRNLTIADNQCHLFTSGAVAIVLTIPSTTFTTGDEIELYTRISATGSIALAAGVGMTLAGNKTLTSGKGGFLKFYSANDCEFIGGT